MQRNPHQVMNELSYYSAEEVQKALPMRDAIEAMRTAFGELSAGRVDMPQRSVVPSESDAVTLVMPGRCNVRYGLGAKIVSVFPGNRERGSPTVQALLILLDEETGAPRALIEGESLTALRTGAASGVATDLFARPDAESVTVIGAGPQARTQLEAVCCVRPIRRVRVCARTDASAERMVRDVALADWLRGASVTAEDAVNEAVAASDIVCTATNAAEPLFPAEVVRPGTHINAVGSFAPQMVEIDPNLLQSAYVVVDHVPAVLAEAGEIITAIKRELIGEGDLMELGHILNAGSVGHRTPDQVTVFKSVGVFVQDLVAGARVVEQGTGRAVR